ncbi:hypothetical protein CC78DRAFT_220846 [Lojkania enalia]|uniref:F-box domain-containing protein n=1 Tax=Lojkania enalia TaxID=147567 RepID=A0A9P4KEU6_9PLEO|nr:hypothetical protein CC78DRAFT_220846 [Didymosphaeria enalia]
MSQVQHTQVIDASRRQSKRKRVQVNYYESEPEDTIDLEEEAEQVFQYSRPKKSRQSRPLPKHKIFPFLELPAEVRNIIYGYCLTDSRGVHLISVTEKYRRTVMRAPVSYMRRIYNRHNYSNDDNMSEEEMIRPQPLVPAILVVNQQLFKEGRDFLYGNEFHVADPLALHSFIVNIGPRAASFLSHITLRGWGGYRGMHKAYNHAAFAVLACATNLKKFKFATTISWGGEPKWIARQLYRDGFPWLEAVGMAKGRDDAAIDIVELSSENFRGRGWRRREGLNEGEDYKKFKVELSKLLNAHTKAVWSKKPKKKVVEEL